MTDRHKTRQQLEAELEELRRRIAELEEEEAGYREVVESANSIIYRRDTSGRITFINEFAQSFFGYSQEEIIGRNVVGTIVPEKDSSGRDLRAMIEDIGKNPQRYRTNLNENIHRSGERVWVAWTNRAICDEEGNVEEILCVGNDVTALKLTEEALSRSEKRYRALVEDMPSMICRFLPSGVLTFVNDEYCSWFNRTREELIGQNFFQFIPEEERGRVKDQLVSLNREKPITTYEHQVIAPDGSLGWQQWTDRAIFDKKGRVIEFQSIGVDVTERRRAEEELFREKEKLKFMVEESPLGISIIKRDGRYDYVNPKFTEMFGYTIEEVPTGREWFEKAYPDPDYRRELISTWINDLKESMVGEGRARTYTVRCKSGEEKIIHFRPVSLMSGSQLVIYEDITDQRLMQEALERSEEKYRLVVDHANVAIFIVQHGILKFPNPKTLALVGYSEHELARMHFWELIADEDREMVQKTHERRLRREDVPPIYSFRIVTKSGEERWVEISAVLFTWEGEPATLNFVRDITPQKKLEAQYRQAQKMEAIGTLAGGIAHDFNNLLQAVQGYADLLMMDLGHDHFAHRDLKEIIRAARRGRDLTRQMLTFSRMVDSDLRPTNLNSEVRLVEKLLARTIPKMIEIRLNLAQDLRPVYADPSQMEQVLMNLTVNARDAMGEGGVLTIETRNVRLREDQPEEHLGAPPGDYVLLTVRDTGHGIDEKGLEHIFDPFYTTKEVGEGTGLGLSMVYGIIKSHNGHITCSSTPGEGAEFRIYLPVIEDAEDRKAPSEPAPKHAGTGTVLIVDDERFIRDLGEKILTRFGYRVLTAEDGESALEIYGGEEDKIDLVILDLSMPGMGGKKCLEKLREMDPGSKVIIASGYSSDALGREAEKLGANGFIDKPFEIDDILACVGRVLS